MNYDNESPNAQKIKWMDELLRKLRAMGFYSCRICDIEPLDATLIGKDTHGSGVDVEGA